LPQDHTVLIALGAEDGTIWQQKLDYLARRSGMALMLTHPDYLDSDRRLDLYRGFLEYVREQGGWWHALPRETTAWWRQREQSSLEQDDQGAWQVRGPASQRATLARIDVSDEQLAIRRLAARRTANVR
jgi:hypothetical protein